jgi:hypothetical protein
MKQTFPSNRVFVKKAPSTFLSFAILFLINIFSFSEVSAQDIIFNVKSYKGGYNVSCNGSTDGIIDAIVVGGLPPYSYSWSNGATTQDLNNVAAGAYTLTVTDALNNSKSKSVTLFEADVLEVFLSPTIYQGGYNISQMGGNDGAITTQVNGGAPPYSYLWIDGSKKTSLSNLIAGTYSVTITDQNGCTVVKSITLIQPTPVSITLSATTYGAYNTSCFKSKDGNINATVSGGMPPYTYSWNNGSFDEDLTNVPADEYKLLVYDANKATAQAQIILTQPNPLELVLTASSFPNNYNISCNGCFNGSITFQITGGTLPATYLWIGNGVTGQTTANLSNLGPGDYLLKITDANGCQAEGQSYLFEPPADGWNKSGNLIDNTNFLGSTNNSPLVFKTNNNEQFRIAENGNVGIGTNNPLAKLDVNGDVTISGLVTTTGISFGEGREISYRASIGGAPAALGWGVTSAVVGPVLALPYCFAPTSPIVNVFPGMTYSFGNNANGGYLNVMRTGFDGLNGIVDVAGSSDGTDPRLLLNYYCGKDVDICTGTSGNVHLTAATNGKVGIGTDNPTEKLDVAGNIRLNSNTLFLKNDLFHGLKYTNTFGGDIRYNGWASVIWLHQWNFRYFKCIRRKNCAFLERC